MDKRCVLCGSKLIRGHYENDTCESCLTQMQDNVRVAVCPVCGTKFIDRTKNHSGRFCSKACKDRYQRAPEVVDDDRRCFESAMALFDYLHGLSPAKYSTALRTSIVTSFVLKSQYDSDIGALSSKVVGLESEVAALKDRVAILESKLKTRDEIIQEMADKVAERDHEIERLRARLAKYETVE